MKYTEEFPGVYRVVKPEKIRTGLIGQYSRMDEYGIVLHEGGMLNLDNIFYWNGANLLPDNRNIMRASAAHDALTRLMKMGLLPFTYYDQVLHLFITMCEEDGVDAVTTNIAHGALHTTFAKRYADPANNTTPVVIDTTSPEREKDLPDDYDED